MATPETEDFLDSLAALAQRERGMLVRVAAHEGLSPQDALECVQDALCTLLRMQRQDALKTPPGEWSALLCGITRNAARNRRRRHALARPHEAVVDQAASALPADELLVRAEAHGKLRACVAELCEIQRAVVLLRLLEEQPGEDVAQVLGISRGYVDVLTHRAKAALRSCMLRGNDSLAP